MPCLKEMNQESKKKVTELNNTYDERKSTVVLHKLLNTSNKAFF